MADPVLATEAEAEIERAIIAQAWMVRTLSYEEEVDNDGIVLVKSWSAINSKQVETHGTDLVVFVFGASSVVWSVLVDEQAAMLLLSSAEYKWRRPKVAS